MHLFVAENLISLVVIVANLTPSHQQQFGWREEKVGKIALNCLLNVSEQCFIVVYHTAEREREREKEGGRERECECVCVYVCVCVCVCV